MQKGRVVSIEIEPGISACSGIVNVIISLGELGPSNQDLIIGLLKSLSFIREMCQVKHKFRPFLLKIYRICFPTNQIPCSLLGLPQMNLR